MYLDIITNLRQFDELKSDWDLVSQADPNSTVFVSWWWVRGWIGTLANNWFVLGLKPDKQTSYVAFLIVRKQNKEKVLHIGGNPESDHTGFICLPEYEEKAMQDFANYFTYNKDWEEFHILDIFDNRLDRFLNDFSKNKFYFQEFDKTCCPYIPLETTWDQYLAKSLNAKKRNKLRRCLKQVRDNNFCINHVNEDNLHRHIDILLKFWQKRWGKQSSKNLSRYRAIFQSSFESGNLFLPVLWNGLDPVSAKAAFLDHSKKSFSGYIYGWDESYVKLSPGTTMHAYAIRYAIENGYKIYDFLRGAEEYKFSSFGATCRYNRNIFIHRKRIIKQLKRKLKSYGERITKGCSAP